MYEYKTLKIKFKHKYKLLANLTLNSIKNTSYMIHFAFISYNSLTFLTIMSLYFDIFSIRNSILSYRLIQVEAVQIILKAMFLN